MSTLQNASGMTNDDLERCKRLARENIERLKAFKANPPPAPVQMDYKETPLKVAIPLPSPARRQYAPGNPSKRAQRNHERSVTRRAKLAMQAPVTLTAAAPYPTQSLIDSAQGI